ncbi:hypothetical protein [uncultured Helicobacter sp.]|uniref:hypothetical protein n=1 Tax=uncultured Helicobacter sp. TaxID=175537 RepID=UPI002597E0E9|nr:hypothetical protein [uncultured Helicobacter sp.]
MLLQVVDYHILGLSQNPKTIKKNTESTSIVIAKPLRAVAIKKKKKRERILDSDKCWFCFTLFYNEKFF